MLIKSAVTKAFLIISVLTLALTLTSCGKFNDFCEELNALSVEGSFPEATNTATLLSDAETSIRQQQVALAVAYSDAYQITKTDDYAEKYYQLTNDRIVAELNNTRSRINSENNDEFRKNLYVILENVTDCGNMDSYIAKRIDDVKNFYSDYIKLRSYTESDYEELTSLLVSNSSNDNSFALWVLKENENLFIESATRSIEKNSDVSTGHSVSLQKNNLIVTAINTVFGGVRRDTDHLSRITAANKKLTTYVSQAAREKQEKLAELNMQ